MCLSSILLIFVRDIGIASRAKAGKQMQSHLLWIVATVIGLLVALQWVRSSWMQRSRLSSLNSKCADLSILHVLVETEFSLVQDAVDCVARLMDNATCPTRLAVHVLEPVTSIKALDIFGPELERACKLAPNFSTFFRENAFVHKVHRTRNLTGPSAMRHLLEHLSRTLQRSDIVMWMPNQARVSKGWDDHVRADMAEAKKRGGHIVVHPLPPMPQAHRDIERFFLPEQPASASFFVLREDLSFDAAPMSRPGITHSIGVSLRHPLASTSDVMRALVDADTISDLALTLFAFSKQWSVFHGAHALGFRMSYATIDNRRQNIHELDRVSANTPEGILDQWMSSIAIARTQDDMQVFGRALMGMSAESSLPEILVKWGSEASFETEKEALRFG
jgi:hypothetical protein